MADLLACPVMPYAWGSRTAIARIQGRPVPSPGPEAELWMGAHPLAPARLVRDGASITLADLVARHGDRELGPAVTARFGARLPFLLKVLAADRPLSLQAHPTNAQARAGFDDEERRGVPRDAPHRNYKDAAHKPELILALTPFDALCGFRRVSQTLALFDTLAVPGLAPVLAPLHAAPNGSGLAATLPALLSMAPDVAGPLVEATVAACAMHAGPFARECEWAVRISRLYPRDPGVLVALLLNLVHLEPGESIYLEAGHLHAYLEGVGIEIMASSDNVLRGGLTTKHVDVAELLNVLTFSDGPVPVLRPRAIDGVEDVFDTPAAEFRLSRIHLSGHPVDRRVHGPEILFCLEGSVRLEPDDGTTGVELGRGTAAFVPASTGRYALTGAGIVFRATVGAEIAAA